MSTPGAQLHVVPDADDDEVTVVDAEMIEIIDYTTDEYLNDITVIRSYGAAVVTLDTRRDEIERAQTIKVARALFRLRHDPDARWLNDVAGGKTNDRRFSEWAAKAMGYEQPRSAWRLLIAGEVLAVMEKVTSRTSFPLPLTEGQMRQLSTLRNLPAIGRDVKAGAEAMIDIWMQAVEDSRGQQPKQAVVEAAVRQHKAARKAIASGDLDGSGAIRAELRDIKARLIEIAQTEPRLVSAAVTGFYHALVRTDR